MWATGAQGGAAAWHCGGLDRRPDLSLVMSFPQGEHFTCVRALSMSSFPVHLQFLLLFHSLGSVFILSSVHSHVSGILRVMC